MDRVKAVPGYSWSWALCDANVSRRWRGGGSSPGVDVDATMAYGCPQTLSPRPLLRETR